MNDVDAGLYGEYRLGAAKGARCAVGVFPGTGIGGGCVYDGKLVTGKNRTAFEFGHMEVVADGPLCGCGRRGCLEAVASRLAISAAAAAAAYRGEAPALLRQTGTDLAKIRSRALAASVAGGDRAVEEILRTAARRIGVAVGNVVNLLAPDVVVLGGGLVEALEELLVSEVRAAAAARAMPAFADLFRVVPAKLGDDAAVLGAATWAEEEVRTRAPAS
jgi:glucokinase